MNPVRAADVPAAISALVTSPVWGNEATTAAVLVVLSAKTAPPLPPGLGGVGVLAAGKQGFEFVNETFVLVVLELLTLPVVAPPAVVLPSDEAEPLEPACEVLLLI